ncbi:hypothetical protein PVL29_018132 [Vitis rotundifolia]|uniref:Uncharacterized protein n=1 Tax=Vitis rotundifolia TaxID=103349 RepID=A0AA38Z474_VITRO|nr:hypothetical protein PVL29_018132 [Vitis rotundifolia]
MINEMPLKKWDSRGLLDLACWELCYELCTWIISNYDIAYHQLNMATGVAVPITKEDVSKIKGIPSNGEEIVEHSRRGISNCTYTISLLEQNLKNLAIGDDFRKTFLIFACATILAPNSKHEGMHYLWDTIWDGDVGVQKIWLQFVFYYIEDEIREYQNNQPTYIRGCLIFLQLFYMTKFYMSPVTVDAEQLQESTGYSHAPAVGGLSSACDDATDVVDVFIDSKSHIRIILSL